ncbi:MAG: ComEC/Rec2 family competence protein [Armatimonadota bacterium]
MQVLRRSVLVVSLILLFTDIALTQQLQIHCIDVGQGDCTLIISPDKKTTMLIDAGQNGCGTKAVLPYLRKLGVDHLDFIISSHYDSDHIGGLDEVIKSIGINNIGIVYDRGNTPLSSDSKTYNNYKSAASSHRKTLILGQVVEMPGGVSIKCIAENGLILGYGLVPNAAKNENNLCVVLVLRYKNFDYYTGGDARGYKTGSYVDLEKPIASVIGAVDVIKVDHHASANSSLDIPFLSTLRPTVAFIEVGASKFRHPTQKALDRLKNSGCIVYQTERSNGGVLPAGYDFDANGCIKLTTDGTTTFNVQYGVNGVHTYPVN